MSILDLTGADACERCGRAARDERDRLMAENAKLRKLIAGINYCHDHYGNHENCPLYQETNDYSDWHNWCKKETLARELGVEVDG